MRTVRISFDKNVLKETYPTALRGYVTPVDFFSRVKVLNTILHRRQKFHRLFRDFFVASIIIAAVTAFVLLAMILKRIGTHNDPSTSTDGNGDSLDNRIARPLRVCLCIILSSLTLATVFLLGFTRNKSERQLRVIEWNVAEWNALDMVNGIKWNLIVKENNNKMLAEKFIQVDIISASLSIPETSIYIHDASHSQHNSTTSLSTTPPPSYEIALTDPPPSLPRRDS